MGNVFPFGEGEYLFFPLKNSISVSSDLGILMEKTWLPLKSIPCGKKCSLLCSWFIEQEMPFKLQSQTNSIISSCDTDLIVMEYSPVLCPSPLMYPNNNFSKSSLGNFQEKSGTCLFLAPFPQIFSKKAYHSLE